MRIRTPLALLGVVLAGCALPAWSQGVTAILQPPPTWTTAPTLEPTSRWSPSVILPGAASWSSSGSFNPPSPWRSVTDLKPLALGSIPPGEGEWRPGPAATPARPDGVRGIR